MADGEICISNGEGFRQFAAWVHFSGQHPQHGAGCRFPSQTAVYQGLAAVNPWHFHRAAAGQHHDDVFIDLCQPVQQGHLIIGKPHVRPVQALRFKPLRQAQIQKHAIRAFRQFHRLSGQFIVSLVQAFKALRKADGVWKIVCHQLQGIICLPSVDHAAACALIPGMSREITDHRHLGAVLQGENIPIVFQKNDALLCGFPDGFMLGFFIHGGGLRLFCQHQGQQFLHSPVNDLLTDFSILHSLQQLTRTVVPGSGHFQVHACPNAFSEIIAAAPIGDNHTVKTPFPTENIIQLGILVGIASIDLVVGGHQRTGLSFLNRNFKVGQIQFPQGTLVQHTVRGHALQFLAVDRKMFGAG